MSNPVQSLLDRLRTDEDQVSLNTLLDAMGQNSYAPLILCLSLLIVSPLSLIPVMPTLSALIMLIITSQALLGREHIWIPKWLGTKTLSGAKLNNALNWLTPTAKWLDNRKANTLHILTQNPIRLLILGWITFLCLCVPVLEFIPLATTTLSAGTALIAAGLFIKNGLLVMAGLAWHSLLATAALFTGTALIAILPF